MKKSIISTIVGNVFGRKSHTPEAKRKEKYDRMFAGSGIGYEFVDVFQGVDILRASVGVRYLAYYPLFDCIVKSADCDSVFTELEMKALYTHEMGHKVNGHSVAGYLSIEKGIEMELVADKHAIDAGLVEPLASALDKLFEVNVKGPDYQPRMEQLQHHLKGGEK